MTIQITRDGPVQIIEIDRPEVRNALSAEVADDLALVLEALPAESHVRFVILRGKGGVFCAGGDLKMFKTVFQGGASREDIVGIDASIIMHPDVWRSSGHLAGFSDPLVDCKICGERFRAGGQQRGATR